MIQLQVLNKILADKDSSIITLNNLNEDYFSDYGAEFKYIKEHLNQYGVVPDLESFLSVFPNFEIINVREPIGYLLEELYKDRNMRYLASSFNDVRKFLMQDNVDKAIQVYKNIYEGLTTSTSLNSIDITKDVSRYDAYIESIYNPNKRRIPTGFKELDDLIGGWDREEELATVVARTNVGKSYLLLAFAVAAVEQGLNVGLYSGESGANKVGYRFDTLVSHISNGSLNHANENIQNDYKRYIDALPNKFKGSLKVLHPTMINGPAGVSALRAFIEKEHLDILFVDQHSLLEDDRKAKNPVEKAANISRDLKNLQVMTRIPIISAAQQNRESTAEHGIGTEHIAQSDRIAQDSTIILALERKDDGEVLKIHLIKSRDSENGKCLTYHVNFNTGEFTYMPDVKNNLEEEEPEEESLKQQIESPQGEVINWANLS